jgi:hypothetical protein
MRKFSSEIPAAEPAASPLEGVSFGLDDETFTCHPVSGGSMFHLTDLARQAHDGDVSAEMAIVPETFLRLLGAAEYQRFTAYIREHDTPDEVVMEIFEWLAEQARTAVEEETGRPTRRRPGSSAGPPERGERMSRVISLGSGDVQVIREVPVPQDHKRPARKRKAG